MRYTDTFEEIWSKVASETMTSKNRGFALFEAVNYVLDHGIAGAFVECGVWRGGSSMIIALTLLSRGVTDRRISLMDTFAGMTEPGEADRDLTGKSAADLLADDDADGPVHAACDVETVRSNMISTGYPRNLIEYVVGDVRSTLPRHNLWKISLLRLDTDFEDSTRAELTHLYPLVSANGVVIIDDYGHWQGARAAVDEFVDSERLKGRHHFLAPLDYTGRAFVKPVQAQTQKPAGPPAAAGPRAGATAADTSARHDYVSDGLEDPEILPLFTHLVRSDPAMVKWPFLRRSVPHVWRTDTRSDKPLIGVLSVDEGAVLYNAAKPFAGRRGLEVGCHLAFSTAHLAKAGLDLDVVDPALGRDAHLAAVQDSLARAVPDHRVRLHAGFSPQILPTVHAAAKGGEKWSFAFIDGLHDGDAPLADARAVEPFLAETSAVMFHDLACPAVAMGLRHFADRGWKTRIFETMQVMGIAWRGDYEPPCHVPDEGAGTADLDHLGVLDCRG